MSGDLVKRMLVTIPVMAVVVVFVFKLRLITVDPVAIIGRIMRTRRTLHRSPRS